jgi:tripartite-type tricarboxylate transporter receptor subunit TctC
MQPLSRWSFAVLVVAAFALPPSVVPAAAGGYPDKPIRLIVPFPPGGSNDILGRYLGTRLTDRLGQQMVIDNRGGANGIIGAELAANAPADGYTLLFISTSWVMNAAVRPLPYDVEKSFDPIAMIGSSPNSIVVHPTGAFGTLRDLVDQAKAKPGVISYASTGVGGFNHFGGELFKKLAGINMVHVPYKGGGPAMIDVIAGNIPVMFTSVTQVLNHVRAGRIKMLAIGSDRRSPAVPDIPTVAESGYPGYDVAVWWGVAAPDGAPTDAMQKLGREITTVLEEPETKKRLLADAAVPKIMTPDEFRRLIHGDVKKWREVANAAGIQLK